jgi:hypothetical protein
MARSHPAPGRPARVRTALGQRDQPRHNNRRRLRPRHRHPALRNRQHTGTSHLPNASGTPLGQHQPGSTNWTRPRPQTAAQAPWGGAGSDSSPRLPHDPPMVAKRHVRVPGSRSLGGWVCRFVLLARFRQGRGMSARGAKRRPRLLARVIALRDVSRGRPPVRARVIALGVPAVYSGPVFVYPDSPQRRP